MNDEEIAVTDAMIRWGGSFVKRLGELYQYADADNARRLREAFPEYWARYARIAEVNNPTGERP